jgi:putative ABC transport system substrate-binding protein
MIRRKFITLLGGAAVGLPLAARAEQVAVPVVGWLDPGSLEARRDTLAAFYAALQETGYREGRNVTLVYSWAENRSERFARLAADLVSRQVDVIAAFGAASALAAKAATTKIPIVFATGGDPVGLGLVSSLSRPGGNLTGISSLGNALASKQLQLLHDLVPGASAMVHLANPDNPNAQSDVNDVQTAAGLLKLQVNTLKASSPGDIDLAFATIARQQSGGVLVAYDPFLNNRVNQIAQLALTQKVPTVFTQREAVTVGGLISYGPSVMESGRPMGVYIGRILSGEKPGDLPIVRPTNFQLVINRITAKSLGLSLPPALVAIADEVIE